MTLTIYFPQLLNLRQTKAVTSTAPITVPIIVVSDTVVAETGFASLFLLWCSAIKNFTDFEELKFPVAS